MNRRLPPATETIASLSRLINPNGFPDVFAGQEPAPSQPVDLPGLSGFQTAIAATKDSVVKVSGQGCGGLVEGSGFVVDDNLIATNAHVIAGIDHISVLDGNGIHTAVPIWFDPNLDLAVLRVSNLAGQPLDVDTSIQPNDTPTALLGYPGGGDFRADSSVIRNEFTAIGRNIYGNGQTNRQVYEIQAHVVPGNSGGPVINQHGDVVAMVFAESTDYANTGYALVTKQVMKEIQQAKYQNKTRDTSYCAE
jgi:S1-C subfamily serine protease